MKLSVKRKQAIYDAVIRVITDMRLELWRTKHDAEVDLIIARACGKAASAAISAVEAPHD